MDSSGDNAVLAFVKHQASAPALTGSSEPQTPAPPTTGSSELKSPPSDGLPGLQSPPSPGSNMDDSFDILDSVASNLFPETEDEEQPSLKSPVAKEPSDQELLAARTERTRRLTHQLTQYMELEAILIKQSVKLMRYEMIFVELFGRNNDNVADAQVDNQEEPVGNDNENQKSSPVQKGKDSTEVHQADSDWRTRIPFNGDGSSQLSFGSPTDTNCLKPFSEEFSSPLSFGSPASMDSLRDFSSEFRAQFSQEGLRKSSGGITIDEAKGSDTAQNDVADAQVNKRQEKPVGNDNVNQKSSKPDQKENVLTDVTPEAVSDRLEYYFEEEELTQFSAQFTSGSCLRSRGGNTPK